MDIFFLTIDNNVETVDFILKENIKKADQNTISFRSNSYHACQFKQESDKCVQEKCTQLTSEKISDKSSKDKICERKPMSENNIEEDKNESKGNVSLCNDNTIKLANSFKSNTDISAPEKDILPSTNDNIPNDVQKNTKGNKEKNDLSGEMIDLTSESIEGPLNQPTVELRKRIITTSTDKRLSQEIQVDTVINKQTHKPTMHQGPVQISQVSLLNTSSTIDRRMRQEPTPDVLLNAQSSIQIPIGNTIGHKCPPQAKSIEIINSRRSQPQAQRKPEQRSQQVILPKTLPNNGILNERSSTLTSQSQIAHENLNGSSSKLYDQLNKVVPGEINNQPLTKTVTNETQPDNSLWSYFLDDNDKQPAKGNGNITISSCESLSGRVTRSTPGARFQDMTMSAPKDTTVPKGNGASTLPQGDSYPKQIGTLKVGQQVTHFFEKNKPIVNNTGSHSVSMNINDLIGATPLPTSPALNSSLPVEKRDNWKLDSQKKVLRNRKELLCENKIATAVCKNNKSSNSPGHQNDISSTVTVVSDDSDCEDPKTNVTKRKDLIKEISKVYFENTRLSHTTPEISNQNQSLNTCLDKVANSNQQVSSLLQINNESTTCVNSTTTSATKPTDSFANKSLYLVQNQDLSLKASIVHNQTNNHKSSDTSSKTLENASISGTLAHFAFSLTTDEVNISKVTPAKNSLLSLSQEEADSTSNVNKPIQHSNSEKCASEETFFQNVPENNTNKAQKLSKANGQKKRKKTQPSQTHSTKTRVQSAQIENAQKSKNFISGEMSAQNKGLAEKTKANDDSFQALFIKQEELEATQDSLQVPSSLFNETHLSQQSSQKSNSELEFDLGEPAAKKSRKSNPDFGQAAISSDPSKSTSKAQQTLTQTASINDCCENSTGKRTGQGLKRSSTPSKKKLERNKPLKKEKKTYYLLSDQLAVLVGAEMLSFEDVCQKLKIVASKRNLVDSKENFIECDQELEEIFGRKRVSMVSMFQCLRKHLKRRPEEKQV